MYRKTQTHNRYKSRHTLHITMDDKKLHVCLWLHYIWCNNKSFGDVVHPANGVRESVCRSVAQDSVFLGCFVLMRWL